MTSQENALPREIFLSHSVKDHAFTTRIAELLRDHDRTVWYAPNELVGGDFWLDELGRALDRCDWFLVVLSPNSIKSRWVKSEVRFALSEPKFEGRIVPILYKTCPFRELSWVLGSIQHVDFTKGFKKGSEDLLKIWDLEVKK